ncbi:3-oxoacyl-[acyl-carrier-protein] reductase [Garciella nitratireducens]|uniref:3-oxoacyl-[acyl-carrier-protein] reductase n=1 Tax=Garciella nitratireducens DSM 15102 TaxID=1121911 RepID=A0A1T4JYB0_9FIRM|nr:3-oxoacyl-[acyl-carrier-protein] reductase [Garciella nitratireducens]RBP41131.1 3-oxoacyl-[acyl-carrier-protein] reductase [Garciella nitratireducens]SJZ35118.1 3-oxoacyl-[acyl-carrier-protein] reductase [Garciella nitratireducens DSM 15102]
MNLENKTAIVTGSSKGIGKVIALQLANAGANVIVNYNHSFEEAKKVVEEIRSMGRRSLAIQADVGKQTDVDHFIQKALDEFKNIDILVNNAGITRDNLLLRMKEKEWDEVLNINLKGTFLMTKAVIRKMMKNKRGKIINISSIVGVTGNAGQSNYAAAKAGIIGFTKSIAREVASRGIQVNAIAPGYIKTEMTDILPESIQKELLNKIPVKRIGDPEDIANMVTFLSSDLSNYITGQVIHIDGGMYM